ncbi:MAG: hypothetical protein WDO19_10615 [Bacteroidota bacterium]
MNSSATIRFDYSNSIEQSLHYLLNLHELPVKEIVAPTPGIFSES